MKRCLRLYLCLYLYLCLCLCLRVPAEFLDIWDVDLMKKREQGNMIAHHTAAYQGNFLIVRRGQEFQLEITFDRPYQPNKDKFAVEFVIGESFAGSDR